MKQPPADPSVLDSLASLTPEQRALLMLRMRQKAARSAQGPELRPISRERELPLSFAQQRLWFMDQWQPRNPAYNITSATRLTGRLDLPALRWALDEIVRRHESLRTGFGLVDGGPVQIAHPPAPLPVGLVDLTALPDKARSAEVRRLVEEEGQRPFDLARDRLVRAALLRCGPEEHVAIASMHHIVSDGWSMAVFVAELGALYAARDAGRPSPLPELPVQYPDFAVWQREWLSGEVLAAQLAYWTKALAGAPPVTELPVTKPWPKERSVQGATVGLRLARESTEALQALARREGATLFMVLLAALDSLLHRYSGATDLLIGTPVAGRNRAELEGLIGFFVNTLVLRADLAGDPPFPVLLARTREAAVGAQAHQDLPFEKLVEELRLERDPLRPLLVQVVLSFQNTPPVSTSLAGVELTGLDVTPRTARYDLLLSIRETEDGLAGYLEYSTDLFDAPAAARLAGHYLALLDGIADDPERRLSELPMLSPAERDQLAASRAPARRFDASVPLHRLFEAAAARAPEAVALSCEGRQVRYGELDRAANRLARRLRALGVGPEERVGLSLQRSPELVIGLLGILKAGGAYVPIDPDLPAERRAFLLADSGVRVVVTQELIESGDDDRPLPDTAGPDNAAYVIYTSGSTGTPKGVVVRHAEVARLLLATQPLFGFSSEDVWTLFHSYAFDFSVWEIWGALAWGGRLVIVPFPVSRSPEAFQRLLEEERVTVLNQTPSAFRALFPVGIGGEGLRWIIFGGEALDLSILAPWIERHGDEQPRLVNMYGITETTVHVTFRRIVRTDLTTAPGSLIGAPLPDLQIQLLDGRGEPVPDLVPGEICVAGDGVARGYLGRPGLTAERFVPDPWSGRPGARMYRSGDLARRLPDGDLQVLGRIDDQVKVRGFRIEPAEIEAVLRTHPAVEQAAVLAQERGEGKRLVAYVVPRDSASPPELRRYAAERLPEPLVPARFLFLVALPLTANGKLDRRALAQFENAGPAVLEEDRYEPPATPAEETLADVWAEALGLHRVGVLDSFFALGGDSILSLRVLAKAREHGLSITLQQLFHSPTIRELARLAGGDEAAHAAAGPFALISDEDRRNLPAGIEDAYPLARLQAGMLFHSEQSPEAAVYHDVFSARVRAPFDPERLRRTLADLAAIHPVLRTSFALTGYIEPLQLVHERVEMPFTVEDLRGVPEADARIAAWLTEERHRGFLWSRPPLLRFHVHRLAGDVFQLTLSFHHSILDGWSAAALLTKLFDLSQRHPEARDAFREFVRLEREALASPATRAFWHQQIAGAEPCLLPRWPLPPGTQIGEARDLPVWVPDAVVDGLRAVAREAGVPLKSVLLAVHVKVLGHATGRPDPVTGLVANGRPEGPGSDEALGLFLNSLPFVLRLGCETWSGLARAAFEAERAMLPHRRFPLAEIQAQAGRPLFDTLFNFVHFHVYQGVLRTPGLELLDWNGYEEVDTPFGANFQLDPAGDHLSLRLTWRDGELDPRQMEAFAGWFNRALETLAAHPEARHAEASLLSATERRQLLVEWGDGGATGSEGLRIHRLFEAQAARTPDRIALVDGEISLTYGDLNAWANRAARWLRDLGVGVETPVGIALEPSPDRILLFLAVLKAGGAYVPLDLASPADRLARMVEQGGVRLIITESVWTAAAIQAGRAENLADGDAGRLAYVMFTSGSTGLPKAVAVEHQGVIRLVRGLFSPDSVFLQISPVTFDAATEEIWGALVNGGRLVLAPAGLPSVDDVARLLERHGVTCLVPSTGLFHQIALARPEILRGLSWVSVGGDVLSPDAVNRVLAAASGCVLLNGYGPTENTTHTAICFLREPIPAGETVPLGRPIPGTQVYLLDADLQPSPLGVPGELYTGGEGLARGYLGRPDLTAERFVPHPFAGEGARLYRTGDRALWHPDGTLRFLGRLDRQIKVRGFRVEPGEVEAALAACPAVRQAAVDARDDFAGGRGLAAYLVPAEPLDGEEAREPWLAGVRVFLQERLPDYLVPSVFLIVSELPLTDVGKVDRRALAALPLAPLRRSETATAPRTPIEEMLAGIWTEILGIESPGLHDDFFALGGQSLLAIQAVSRIRAVFGVEIPLRWLFESPTIAGLAERLAGALRAEPARQAPPLRPRSADAPADLPLSFAQERLWFLEQLQPGTATYNIPAAVRLRGTLDVGALDRSLAAVAARHEALRTRFPTVNGEPVQVIDPPPAHMLTVVDLSALPEETDDGEARAIAGAEALRAFDLVTDLPLRAVLLVQPMVQPVQPRALPWAKESRPLGPENADGVFGGAVGPKARASLAQGNALGWEGGTLLLTLHHIAADGWSMGLLVREAAAFYRAGGSPNALPPLPIQYADFALWQREWLQGDVLAAHLDFWRERLAGAPALLALPTDRPRPPVQSFRGDRRHLRLDSAAVTALEGLGRRCGSTLFMTLLAAFDALLARFTGETDIVLGVPSANRNRAEIEGLIGFFVNTLAVRVDLSGDPSFPDLIARVRETALAAFAHQDLPFEKLVAELRPERGLSHTPLFQVLFQLLDLLPAPVELPGLTLEMAPEAESRTTKFDLVLSFERTAAGLFAEWRYNTDLFDGTTIQRMANAFHVLVDSLAAAPDRPLSDLPLLPEPALHQITVEWNATQTDLPDASVPELFFAQAARTPNAVAVVCDGEVLTYFELASRVRTTAYHLAEQGTGPESVVAVLAERGPDYLINLLAILAAGGVYLPLDPTHPESRIAYALEQSGARMVLGGRDAPHPIPRVETLGYVPLPLRGTPSPGLDEAGELPRRGEGMQPRVSTLGWGAYILYTSGSTGHPKAAMLTHRGLLNHLLAKIADLHLTAADTVAQTAAPTFDISIWQHLAALLAGGRVAILRDPIARDPHRLLAAVDASGVTLLEIVPSLLAACLQVLDEQPRPSLSSLRWLISTGEALPPDLARGWLTARPDIPLLNAYGPTECADRVSHQPLRRPPLRVPIGRPIANTRLHVLDAALRPVPIGVAGDLYVAGAGVGRGYSQDPARTAEVFVPDPLGEPGGRLYRTGDRARHLADGTLEYLGRRDHQVKIRGIRIETGEVAAALQEHPEVRQALVVAKPQPGGGLALAAYWVPNRRNALDSEALRAFLRQRLPEALIPRAFVELEGFPLLANGKIDRLGLPDPFAQTREESATVAPRTPLEELIAELWAEALGPHPRPLSHLPPTLSPGEGGTLAKDISFGLFSAKVLPSPGGGWEGDGRGAGGEGASFGVHDNFFALGGDSIKGAVLIHRLQRRLGTALQVATLFEAPTIASLAARLQDQPRSTVRPPLIRHAEPGPPPLSFAQERLWFLQQLEPEGAAYNMPLAFRLRGPVDAGALDHALTAVVRRHHTLRTRFAIDAGRPVPVLDPPPARLLAVIDLAGLPAGRGEAEARAWIAFEAGRPFDLETGPLVRSLLLRLNGDESAALFVAHHVACDGWSLWLWAHEIGALYRGAALPGLPVQYEDFARWQREWMAGGELAAQVAWWRERLAGMPPSLDLPADRPRPRVQTVHGASVFGLIPADVSDALRSLGQRHGASPFMVLLAAFAVLLHRLSGQDDIAVGSPIAGRTHPEVENLIGCFLNTLVLRTDLSGNPPFPALLARVRETALGAYAHQDVPFEKLLEDLRPQRDLSRPSLFQVLFNMLNAPSSRLDLPGLEIQGLDLPETLAKFDLTLYLADQADGIALHLVYNTDLFDGARMEEMLRQYRLLLAGIAERPEAPIHTWPLLTPEARAVLPDPTALLSHAWVGAVHDLMAERARRHPDRTALIDRAGTWTYGELDLAVRRLAARLQADGIRPGDRVAIYAHRSASLVWAILGVLKTGAAFTILDPIYPPARLVEILRLARPQGLLHLKGAGPLPASLTRHVTTDGIGVRSLPCGTAADALARFAAQELPSVWPERGAQDIACVAFTSGSTGVPKGILQTHGSMSHFIPWHRDTLGFREADRHTLLSGLAHDPLHRDMFYSLSLGATLCVPDPGRIGEPGYLAGWMREQRITVTNMTPAMAQLLTELPAGAPPLQLPDLRCAILAGDILTRRDVDRVRRLAPQAVCLNVYGATESQRALSWYRVEEGSGGGAKQILPLGRGKADVQLLLLTPSGLAGIGEIGEIAIRSPHLAHGYLDDPEQTARLFVINPFTGAPGDRVYLTGDLGRYLPNGAVTAAGRADQQVKIRGFRVEPGEIEAEVGRLPGVRESAVLGKPGPDGERRLVAYVVLDPVRPPRLADLRESLRSRLPAFMVPAVFVPLDRLPLNPNGKVDRRALPDPEDLLPSGHEPAAAHMPPRDALELRLVRIWEEVLETRPVGVTDDFFALGGHSLLAVRLMARLAADLGRTLPLAALFQAPTIEDLARLLRRAEPASEGPLVRLREGGAEAPLFLVHPAGGQVLCYVDLARALETDRPVWGLQDTAPLDAERSLESLAAAYLISARTVHPGGPWHLAGWSFGGRVAFEMARQLVSAGEEVAFLGMIDTGLVEPSDRHRTDADLLIEALGPLPIDPGDLRRSADPLAALVAAAQSRGTLPPGYDVTAARRHLDLFKRHLEIARTDPPRPYPGRLTFFAAEDNPVDETIPRDHGWSALAAEIEIVPVPGDHVTLIRDPENVRVLAGALACLDPAIRRILCP